jgi:hypothetical protein
MVCIWEETQMSNPVAGDWMDQMIMETPGFSPDDTAVAKPALPSAPDTSGVTPIELSGVWDWLTDPLGAGKTYMPTSDQLQKISAQQKKPFPWWMVGIGVGVLLLASSNARK